VHFAIAYKIEESARERKTYLLRHSALDAESPRLRGTTPALRATPPREGNGGYAGFLRPSIPLLWSLTLPTKLLDADFPSSDAQLPPGAWPRPCTCPPDFRGAPAGLAPKSIILSASQVLSYGFARQRLARGGA